MTLDHQAVLAPHCSQQYGKNSRIGLSKVFIITTLENVDDRCCLICTLRLKQAKRDQCHRSRHAPPAAALTSASASASSCCQRPTSAAPYSRAAARRADSASTETAAGPEYAASSRSSTSDDGELYGGLGHALGHTAAASVTAAGEPALACGPVPVHGRMAAMAPAGATPTVATAPCVQPKQARMGAAGARALSAQARQASAAARTADDAGGCAPGRAARRAAW